MTITLTGSSSFGLKQELNRLKADFISRHGDLSLEKCSADGLSPADLSQILASQPLLASQKLVILEDLNQNQDLAEELAGILKIASSSTELIIYEPSLDRRLKLYKHLKTATDFREINELGGPALANWTLSYAREQGGQISYGDASYLIELIGQNQLRLASELDKLTLYDPHITRSSINLLVEASPQSTIFQLIETAFKGQASRAISIYRQQRQAKVTPRDIIGLITWQLHLLALVKSAGHLPPNQIAKQAGLNPYPVSKAAATARSLSLNNLKALIKSLLKIDLDSKRTSLDLDEAVEDFILKLAGLTS